MKGKLNRRSFIRLSALFGSLFGISGIIGNAAAGKRSKADLDNPGSSTGSTGHTHYRCKPRGKSRIATIQSNHVPTCEGLEVDPFFGGFSMDDLLESIERRIEWYEGLFEQAAGDQCDLVVVTEDFTRLSLPMKYLDDRSVFRNAVEKQTLLVPERFSSAAGKHGMYIVACYFAAEGDKIFNVADLFGRSGEFVGRYRKVHLPQYELWQVTVGDSFPAFETDLGWVGMLICYDQMWPEAAASCAMNGAQLICQPSAASLTDFHMKTRAKDNLVHHISSTYKNSMIVSPMAEILANTENRDPAIAWADVDLRNCTRSDDYYWEHLFSGIRDHKERHLKFRQPDAYRVLIERKPPLMVQYREGGVASTPEAIDHVYGIYKEMHQKQLKGEPVPYHWGW